MASTLMDDDWCEINSNAIGRMFETLVRDIDCTKYFPSLRSAFILSADDCDEIRHEGTRRKMVMKFLDILDKNKKPNVVEELLKAIRKDKTMPVLHQKLCRFYVAAKEEYKRKTNKQEATPPQQRTENGRSSASSIDDVGPVPPPPALPPPEILSCHSPSSLPSPSSYTSLSDSLDSATPQSSIHQRVSMASMSSQSSNFSSSPIPGPPPASHNKKAASAITLSSTNCSDPSPPLSQIQDLSGRGGPAVASPGVSQTSNVHRYSNLDGALDETNEETEAMSNSGSSDAVPVCPPELTELHSVRSSAPPTMDDEAVNASKTKAPCSQSVLDFSHIAHLGSPGHSGQMVDSSNSLRSLAPTSGEGEPGWMATHFEDATRRIGSTT